ncbi:polysaccharide biosynthesis tyrosine autokinase [Anabaena sp. FACHB-1237]|uniref:GumC family protein n=1 Tax=Anabaena sp. FACHB-1237 TaxID=2692769 RepID=UPI001680777D|nr:polysaccharide biosynthesis tyrosine autokinase [Anabaena sp. FACHB-1237]MBD2136874.1 polysaccharide biosynthesis tyrosine autokinase [Anabaena sp. FACHB-1237]
MNNHHTTSNFPENGLLATRNRELAPSILSSLITQEDDKSLKDYLGILQRHALTITGVIILGMTGVTYSAMNQEPIYQESFQVLVEPIDSDATDQLTLTESQLIKRQGLDYESQIQVLKSRETLEKTIQELQKIYPDITYIYLVQNLTIRRVGETKILEVAYKSNDPKKIKTVLDVLSKNFLKYSLDQRQTKLRQAMKFVDEQFPKIENRVEKLQKELQIFRQRYNFIDPENQSSAISSQIQLLSQQRLTLNQQIVAARNNYLSLQQPQEQLLILNNSPNYQQLIAQQRQLEVQISGELARFSPNNPVIVTLQEKKSNLAPLIQQETRRVLTLKLAEAESNLKKVEVDNQLLMQTERQLQQKLTQLPVLTRQYATIVLNLQLANESLTRFLANKERLQIEVAQTELPWSLIKAAEQPRFPISPNIPRQMLLGMVACSLLGVGTGLLMEKIDTIYHSVDQVKEKIRFPILGILPFDKSMLVKDKSANPDNESLDDQVENKLELRNILGLNNSRSSKRSYYYYQKGGFSEALQILYSNIQLLNSDQPINSLVISSSLPGDGKSTVSFNLAKTVASMGKKVLLVDTDLRLSSVHKLAGLKNLWGLSNLIATNIPCEQIIQELPDFSNLSVLTAGSLPPDPARLLSSDKMKQLMDYFHDNFDLVIYDAPPMLSLVDARLIAPHTNGVMLVVRMNKTDKSSMLELQESLKVSPINILGMVVNADKNRARNYNYYYNYYNQPYPNQQVSS